MTAEKIIDGSCGYADADGINGMDGLVQLLQSSTK